jgi:pimeloyl-ACP methyl ester carboxylesterase
MVDQGRPHRVTRRSFLVAGTAATMTWSSALRLTHAESGTGNINFRVAGAGEPTLLFVHGFTCSLEDWDGQVKGLSPRFRCAALDLPGHGASARPDVISIGAMGEAVNKVKARIAGRRTVLIGHSMGCRVITEAFQQSPASAVGLVYVDGSIIGGDPEVVIKRTKEAVDRGGIDAFTEKLFNDMFLDTSDANLRQRLVARAKSVDGGFREALLLDTIRWDIEKSKIALRQTTVPVLVLQSTYINSELKRVPLQAGMTTPWMDAVASLVAHSEAKIVRGAGHFAMIEAAQDVNDAIEKFADHLA